MKGSVELGLWFHRVHVRDDRVEAWWQVAGAAAESSHLGPQAEEEH